MVREPGLGIGTLIRENQGGFGVSYIEYYP